TVILNEETANVFDALDDLVQNPNTLLGIRDLNALTRSGEPLFRYIAPFQTVCNYGSYFLNALGSHISEGTASGTAERVLLKSANNFQDDVAYNNFGARPSDLPANVDPTGAKSGPEVIPPEAGTNAAYTLHNQPYPPAIDAQGNANCAKGQFGYVDGPLTDDPGRYPPANGTRDPDGTFNTWQREHGGGSHPVVADNAPWLYGPTFTGLENLSQVDAELRRHGIEP
ncbi:MAG TPA: hypothetical protein VJT75_04875, partial [Thermoleophilaceae bacterium]|nr:hypothetical protein [Thermoleophilaceae bacterium]